MAPRRGMDARHREAYELLELTVDGRPQPIRRSTRATGQTYSVDLDEDAKSSAPSPLSGATGCTSPSHSRHEVGHYAWTTQTPILPKSKSVTPSRQHHPHVSLTHLRQYRARSSQSRPLAGSSPGLVWPSPGQPTTSCPRPSSLRQQHPPERGRGSLRMVTRHRPSGSPPHLLERYGQSQDTSS